MPACLCWSGSTADKQLYILRQAGNKKPVTGKDLRTALDLLIKNKSQKKIQKPSIGCNIKWK